MGTTLGSWLQSFRSSCSGTALCKWSSRALRCHAVCLEGMWRSREPTSDSQFPYALLPERPLATKCAGMFFVVFPFFLFMTKSAVSAPGWFTSCGMKLRYQNVDHVGPAKESHLGREHRFFSQTELFSSLASTTSKGDEIKVSISR